MSNPAYQNYLTELQNFVNAISTNTAQDKSDSYSGTRDSNGLPHGYGKMVHDDGSVYEGQFNHGRKNGSGKSWDYNNQLAKNGVWENDEIKDGWCIFNYEDGQHYEGEIKSRLRHGKGVNIWPDGAKYEGEWVNNERNGIGDQLYAEGTKYKGEFKNGCRNGKGRYELTDGNSYDGEWKDGKKNGQGIFTWTDGNCYNGGWEDDQRVGKGNYTWPNGNHYDGEWKTGNMDGFGILINTDGSRYEGEWKDAKKHGKGIFIYVNGDKYEGEFSENFREGIGILVEKNGRKYEGEWKSDKKDGNGTYFTEDRKTKKGLFIDDHFRKGEISYCGNGDVILKGEFDIKELHINGTNSQIFSGWGHEIIISNYCCISGKCWDENGTFEGSFMCISNKECGHNEPPAIPNNGISKGFDGRYGKILNGKLEGTGIKTGQDLGSFKEYGHVTRIEGYFVHDEPQGDCHLTLEDGLTVNGEGDGNGNLSMFIQ